jgi:hypothetical protein
MAVNLDYYKIKQAALEKTRYGKSPLEIGLMALFPLPYFAYRASQKLANYIVESSRFSENDKDNIIQIIKCGKEQGVDELNLQIKKSVGIDIGAKVPIEGLPINVDVRFKIGNDSEIIMNVKYK